MSDLNKEHIDGQPTVHPVVTDLNTDDFKYCQKCRKYLDFETVYKYEKKYREIKKVEVSEKNDMNYQHNIDKNFVDDKKTKDITECVILNQILECPMCKNVIFNKIVYENSIEIESIVYPERPPSWNIETKKEIIKLLNDELFDIYKEIITAYNSSLQVSAAACLRAFIERICKLKGIEGGRISQLIDKLECDENYRSALHEIRKIGNDSIHNGYIPDLAILHNAIRAIELFTQKMYEDNSEIKSININLNNRIRK